MGIRKPRPDYDPTQPVRALCPACLRTYGPIVNAACGICAGTGTITLGHPALTYDEPGVVARAIHLALGAATRTILTATTSPDLRNQAIPAALTRLIALGILDPGQEPPPCPPIHETHWPRLSPKPPSRSHGPRTRTHHPMQPTLPGT